MEWIMVFARRNRSGRSASGAEVRAVYTTGGHLRAIAKLLARNGMSISHALCAAETVHSSQSQTAAFAHPEQEIEI